MLLMVAPAHAYEFWLRARSYGQAYQLREYRLVGPDLFLGRRRFTQMLSLRLYDLGDLGGRQRHFRRQRSDLHEQLRRIRCRRNVKHGQRLQHFVGRLSANQLAEGVKHLGAELMRFSSRSVGKALLLEKLTGIRAVVGIDGSAVLGHVIGHSFLACHGSLTKAVRAKIAQ